MLNSKDCVQVAHISEIVYSLTHLCSGVYITLYVSIIPPCFLTSACMYDLHVCHLLFSSCSLTGGGEGGSIDFELWGSIHYLVQQLACRHTYVYTCCFYCVDDSSKFSCYTPPLLERPKWTHMYLTTTT